MLDDRSFSDGCVTHQLGELSITSDTKIDVLRLYGSSLRLVSEVGVVASEFQDFSTNVLEDGSHVDSCCDRGSL